MENNDRQIELKFQRFFTVNFPKVKNFAQMLLKSEADAEDVAQDVFCKLWLQPELWLDNDKELDNYIFIMTRNIVLNIFKHQQVEQEYQGSVVILGGLSLVNSLHAYTFASLKRKKLISTTPLNDALNALILALNASAAAFVLLFTKKFRILS